MASGRVPRTTSTRRRALMACGSGAGDQALVEGEQLAGDRRPAVAGAHEGDGVGASAARSRRQRASRAASSIGVAGLDEDSRCGRRRPACARRAAARRPPACRRRAPRAAPGRRPRCGRPRAARARRRRGSSRAGASSGTSPTKRARSPRRARACASYSRAPLAVAADHQRRLGDLRHGLDQHVQSFEVVGAIEAGEEEDRRLRRAGRGRARSAARVAAGGEGVEVDAGRDHHQLALERRAGAGRGTTRRRSRAR